jgi:hypothetical protein
LDTLAYGKSIMKMSGQRWFSLHPFYWGKGYMKEALHEVCASDLIK